MPGLLRAPARRGVPSARRHAMSLRGRMGARPQRPAAHWVAKASLPVRRAASAPPHDNPSSLTEEGFNSFLITETSTHFTQAQKVGRRKARKAVVRLDHGRCGQGQAAPLKVAGSCDRSSFPFSAAMRRAGRAGRTATIYRNRPLSSHEG
eukprot:scaffold4058_cov121-Isochrysis_galbana.AAC.6